MNYEQAKETLKKHGQGHVLNFFNGLDDCKKQELLNQIEALDFDLVDKLYLLTKSEKVKTTCEIVPVYPIKKENIDGKAKYIETGINAIKSGKLAFVTMAGGQGTRLGFNGPKGSFILDTENNKSLFELLCDTLKEAKSKFGVVVPWYIMTSRENNLQTIEFFKVNNYFNYGKNNIHFFIQGELPMVLENGKVVMESKYKIKEASDGHGGVLRALGSSGALEDMKSSGVEWVFIGGIDNCLLKMVDPLLIGLCIEKKYLQASKTILKISPDEKVGVFCKRNNRPSVVEYSEISGDMANLRDESGKLVYGQSHILCNLFSTSFLDRIKNESLPYHIAHKKTNYIDENGNLCVPDKPNAYKFETFIFDAFEMEDDILLLETKREDEYAPLKNREGESSPETAYKLLKEFRKNNGGK